MVFVAQLVRALDCGSRGSGFETHLSPFCPSGGMVDTAVLETVAVVA